MSVRAAMDRVGVLQAEGLLPEDVVGADDRGREAGNARLNAQRFDVVAETSEDQVLGRQRHPDEQGQGDRQNEQGTGYWTSRSMASGHGRGTALQGRGPV